MKLKSFSKNLLIGFLSCVLFLVLAAYVQAQTVAWSSGTVKCNIKVTTPSENRSGKYSFWSYTTPVTGTITLYWDDTAHQPTCDTCCIKFEGTDGVNPVNMCIDNLYWIDTWNTASTGWKGSYMFAGDGSISLTMFGSAETGLIYGNTKASMLIDYSTQNPVPPIKLSGTFSGAFDDGTYYYMFSGTFPTATLYPAP